MQRVQRITIRVLFAFTNAFTRAVYLITLTKQFVTGPAHVLYAQKFMAFRYTRV